MKTHETTAKKFSLLTRIKIPAEAKKYNKMETH